LLNQTGGKSSVNKSADRFELFRESVAKNTKFNLETELYTLKINNDDTDFIKANKSINDFFLQIHGKITNNIDSNDKIFMYINHPSLDMPITIPFMDKEDFTPDLISYSFIKVCQSKRMLKVDEELELKIQKAKIPKGSGAMDEYIDIKKSIITIKNKDNFCCIRAFFLGKAIADAHKRIDNLSRENNREIESLTKSATLELGIENKPCGISEICKLEGYFRDYQVTVYNDE